ncbi:tripartite tricarboxylate transporter TctB family protein [Pelagibacterium limicola]|uniref:tripartite tricarboxylate transporter TctB family protein n=1 Tax=Pelagibacterium limicola TaxID=2791022 RepID=UPI0018AF5C06|nr:tripartite tricarboxylate transporter TctB family protein [Pelagibacterium limicola]
MTINSEILASLIFLFFGVTAIVFGAGFGFGTPRALGAGAMPVLVGGALCILGGVQFLRALRANGNFPAAFSRSEIRPLVFILSAVFAFATLILPVGLVPALALLIAIAWFSEKGGRHRELVGAMVVVIVVMIAIFNFGLGLPIRLFAWGF